MSYLICFLGVHLSSMIAFNIFVFYDLHIKEKDDYYIFLLF